MTLGIASCGISCWGANGTKNLRLANSTVASDATIFPAFISQYKRLAVVLNQWSGSSLYIQDILLDFESCDNFANPWDWHNPIVKMEKKVY